MKRLMTYHPPRVEDVIQTFPTADRLGAFLFRRLQETPLPYLTLPYLVYGSTDHEAPPDCPVHEFAVELRPRVTPVPCVGEDGFQLRVVAPRTRTPEEGQPGEWSVRDEDYEVVEAEQFRVRRLARAFQARCDGVEELRIELWPSKLFGVLGDDDEPLAHYETRPAAVLHPV